jgi:hypothetical protein
VDAKHLRIDISDTGHGIPREAMPHISLLRQLGGAIGLAVFGSLIGTNATIARAALWLASCSCW